MNLSSYFEMLLDPSIQLQVLFIALFKFKISIWYFLYYMVLWCSSLLCHLISSIHKPYTFQELCLNILISKPLMAYVKWSVFLLFFSHVTLFPDKLATAPLNASLYIYIYNCKNFLFTSEVINEVKMFWNHCIYLENHKINFIRL